MPQNICHTCNSALSQRSPGLECCFCEHFYHIRCVNISKNQFDVLSSVDGCNWRCTGCAEQKNDNSHLIKAIETLQERVKLLQQITQLQNDRVNNTEEQNENLMSEISERQKRSKNVIFYGLTVNPDVSDRQNVISIIKSITPDVRVEELTTARLGNGQNGKPAPLRVGLSPTDDVLTLLRCKKDLRNKSVVITTDQTKMQREYYQKIRTELLARKQNGEQNIFIKYINGVPKIEKSKNLRLSLVI